MKPRAADTDLPARTKPSGEAAFQAWTTRGIDLPPVSLRLIPPMPEGVRADAVLEAVWGERTERFVVAYKALGSPKAIESAAAQARLWGDKTGLKPLVVVPYLSEDALRRLEADGVSGMDLCGNGVLLAADFAVWRTGAPNRYTSGQPIRNVYRGTSSLFARAFLLKPEFDSLVSLQRFTRERLGATGTTAVLAKGTASKVVQALDEDLVVRREEGGAIRLVDAKRLLNRLRENYRKPDGGRIVGATALDTTEIWQRLSQGESQRRAVVTGAGSAQRYGMLSGSDPLRLYVCDLDAAAQLLEIRPTRVFPNLELIESREESVRFDTRERDDGRWASPIQTWLELATGGPRERDAAQTLYQMILDTQTEGLP